MVETAIFCINCLRCDRSLSPVDPLPSPCPATPVVLFSVSVIRIQLGGTVTLTCTVVRSNPSNNYMYTWTLLPSTTVRGPTASTQSTDMLDVTLDMEDDYGTYRCSVENDAGLTGTADTTIEQGCKSSHCTTYIADHKFCWHFPSLHSTCYFVFQ